ncbi:tumor protein p53-inducible protein 13 [Hoplias malabaricus]|uniref:tumor protein p53-inducible protein 13 n=1 Tax=Hoplias malabaricus TaxID=27720 RepID=UPI0034636922
MRLKAVSLSLYGLTWLCVIKYCRSSPSPDCDNGKTKLEMDLPHSDELVCSEPWTHVTLRHTEIATKYSLQPAEHICMNMSIKYNHIIPNSGAHRPVGVMSGQYRYCPPQRWLNNLKDGATVLLYHPCVSEDARRGLAVLAHSCLPHYILTAHPQLSQHRPFALVSWGQTLEMSHVNASGVCEWLYTVYSTLNQTKENRWPKYNLYLTKAAPVTRVFGPTVKSLRACCVEALAAYERNVGRTRKIRAALQTEKEKGELKRDDEANLSDNPALNFSESKNLNSTQTLNISVDKEIRSTSPQDQLQAADKSTVDTKEKTTKEQLQTLDVIKHRIKTDTEEQDAEGGCGQGQCIAHNTGAPNIGGPLQGQRVSTARSDEAVWAAAALGFLLVLLTLSVLHTRLYRHWRAPPSLYWRETQQDYESVGDIIRRRLRMVGRRKRRVSQSRRQECPLLPNSSTDNESD